MTLEVVKIKDTGQLGLLMIKGKFGLDNIYADDGSTKLLSDDEYEHYGELEIDDTESRKTTKRDKKSKK